MAITATTHLNFTGSARSALEFYRSVFGGELRIATYAEFGMPAEVPGADMSCSACWPGPTASG